MTPAISIYMTAFNLYDHLYMTRLYIIYMTVHVICPPLSLLFPDTIVPEHLSSRYSIGVMTICDTSVSYIFLLILL